MSYLRSPAVLLALIILGAFAIGLYRIGYESLTIDEADVVAFAQESWGKLLAKVVQPGENGPLYLLLLHAWIGVAGISEFSLRFFSLAFTILTLPVLYLLGRRITGSPAALVSTLLFACSTYVLQYSQLIKMYTMVTFLATLSGYLLLRALEHPSRKIWVAYTIVTSAAMYTHIFGAMLIPWHITCALIDQRRQGKLVRPWIVSLGFLTLPYLPLGLLRLAALRNPETLTRQFTGSRDLIGMLVTLAHEYGTLWDGAPEAWLKWGFVLLTVAGVVAVAWRKDNCDPRTSMFLIPRSLFLVLGIAVPVIITFIFVTLGAPLFSSRYLIVTLPCFYLLWGAAIVGVRQAVWATVGVRRTTPAWNSSPLPRTGEGRGEGATVLPKAIALLPSIALVLLFIFVNEQRWAQTAIDGQRFHEDWRSGTALLEAHQIRGEQVILLHDADYRVVNYYSTAPLALVSLEGGPDKPPDMARTPTLPSSGSIWLMAAYFEVGPDLSVVEQWLDSHATLVDKTWVTGVMVSQYQLRS